MRGIGHVLASACWAFGARPARSAALVIILAAGVTAVVFTASVVAGFAAEIDRLAFGSYARALVVRENAFVRDRHGPPRLSEAQALAREVPGVEATAAWVQGRSQAYVRGETIQFDVFGVTGRYSDELDTPVAQGRSLTSEELGGDRRACLVGADLGQALGPAGRVGARLSVQGVSCEVVGVLGEPRSRPATRFRNAVVAPFLAASRYFARQPDRASAEADWITLFMRPGTDMQTAEMGADLVLRRLRGVPLSRPSPFAYGDPAASLSQQVEQRDLVTRMLLAVTGLTLVASLLGFAAMASASVVQRRREIALRMAMGATGGHIRLQLALEMLIVGLIAGIAGLTCGLGAAALSARFWRWPFAAEPEVGALAVGVGVALGLFVGLVQGGRAAALPPSLAARL
ncbi:MAG TPA: ABC transporter permease [Baekduia sp.]|nr:ABC transporter permease [Baekduia sp.]